MPFLDDLQAGLAQLTNQVPTTTALPAPPKLTPEQIAAQLGFGTQPLVTPDLQKQQEMLRLMGAMPYVAPADYMPVDLQKNIDDTQLEAERQIGHAVNQQNIADIYKKMRSEREAREFARREAEFAAGKTNVEFRDPHAPTPTPSPSRRR